MGIARGIRELPGSAPAIGGSRHPPARSDGEAMKEPWLLERVGVAGRLYRVSRPGRSLGSDVFVPDEVVAGWIEGVAYRLEADRALETSGVVDYVCLLGRKRDGRREIADFYNARGPDDGDDAEKLRKLLWEPYLNRFS